jgi:hypothetical protein
MLKAAAWVVRLVICVRNLVLPALRSALFVERESQLVCCRHIINKR